MNALQAANSTEVVVLLLPLIVVGLSAGSFGVRILTFAFLQGAQARALQGC
jgi:hypothetical protein